MDKKTIFLLAMMCIFIAQPVFAQAQENFSLNFPTGNGTTTVITGDSVAQQQSGTLILLVPIGIAIAVAIGALHKFQVI